MGIIKRNEANNPTLMGVPVPGLVTPKNLNRKLSKAKDFYPGKIFLLL